MLNLSTLIAGAGLALTTYSTYRAGRAAEESANQQTAGAYQQIEYVKEAALIQDVADAEAALALRQKTDLDLQTVSRRESEVLAAAKANEDQFATNLDSLQKQVSIIQLQKQREIDKAVGTSRARAAGAGIVVGSGATAEVSKDISLSGQLEKASIALRARETEERLNEEITKSSRDVYVALQNVEADRQVLDFNYNVAARQQELSIQLRDIERDMKIESLRTGAQVIQAGQTDPALGAFNVALRGIGRMRENPVP